MALRAGKRFYKEAGAAATEGGRFAVTLDGRPVRTPGGNALETPGAALAQAIASEWQAQEEKINPHSMPLTTLACTAIDRVAAKRDDVIGEALKFAASDLLCYRAEAPEDLAVRQCEHWQPLLDWVGETYGAHLNATFGIVHVPQPPQALEALRRPLQDLSDLQLTVLSAVTATTGSLVLSLTLTAGRLNADEVFALAQLDETYQNEKWGEDLEAAARTRRIREEIEAAETLLQLAAEEGEG